MRNNFKRGRFLLTTLIPLLCLSVEAEAKESEKQQIIIDNVPTMTITGDKELPQVLYIVPWKTPALPKPPAPPLTTPEFLEPVEPSADTFNQVKP